ECEPVARAASRSCCLRPMIGVPRHRTSPRSVSVIGIDPAYNTQTYTNVVISLILLRVVPGVSMRRIFTAVIALICACALAAPAVAGVAAKNPAPEVHASHGITVTNTDTIDNRQVA